VYSYPPARVGGDVDDYYGEPIADAYRWLETTTDAETVSWIWHEAGRRANKQNVFDDFCACAVWLATSGWSRRDGSRSWAARTADYW
jgi:hypothetical protein